MSNKQSVTTQAMHGDTRHGGHLYMQTNETRNAVIHYLRSPSGTITEVERILTGGLGSGAFSPIYQVSRPNDFEGAGSLILTPDRRFLLTTNAGDNSVSSCWTSSRRGTPQPEGAAPPIRWPMPPRVARFSCYTRSAPTMSG